MKNIHRREQARQFLGAGSFAIDEMVEVWSHTLNLDPDDTSLSIIMDEVLSWIQTWGIEHHGENWLQERLDRAKELAVDVRGKCLCGRAYSTEDEGCPPCTYCLKGKDKT